MEPDVGAERAGLAARPDSLPALPALLHSRNVGRLHQRLNKNFLMYRGAHANGDLLLSVSRQISSLPNVSVYAAAERLRDLSKFNGMKMPLC